MSDIQYAIIPICLGGFWVLMWWLALGPAIGLVMLLFVGGIVAAAWIFGELEARNNKRQKERKSKMTREEILKEDILRWFNS